jgi:hypothetical protein
MRARTFTHGWSRRRHGPVGSLAVVCLALVAAMLAAPSASAAVNSYFELEGNVLDDASTTPPDWGADGGTNSIFSVSGGVGVPRTSLPANFFDAGFTRDFIPGSTGDTSAYAGGGKDLDNVSAWACKSESNTTDKGDIQNAYAAVATDPTNGNLLLYFGMEKNAPNGNNNMGVWFLQDGSAGCDGTNVSGNGRPFTGNHTDGDILLVAAFTNGGSTPTVNAYRWNGGATGSLSGVLSTGGACGTPASANLCAITNDTTNVTTPWRTTNKASSGPSNKTGEGTTLGPDQFYEGAVDLTANNLDRDSEGNPVCVNRFVFNTRSSQETTATLYDFAAGDVQTCFSPSITTLLKEDKGAAGPSPEDVSLPSDGDHTVTLPANVYDTSSVTGGVADPTGTVTYSLWTDSACTVASTDPTFSGGGNTATVTVGQPSPTLMFTAADEYWWQATYNPSASSRNNPATSVCTSEPLVVEKVSPTIATTPSAASIEIGNGNSFSDTATISGGYFPSGGIAPGNVEFKLYGPFTSAPGATDCTAGKLVLGPSSSAAGRVDDTTATATSASYTPTAVGIYQWTAKYLGNAQNNATAESACGDTTEQVTVQPVAPSIATRIALSDRAKVTGVTGAGAVTGTVRFTLHPSLDCSGAAIYDSQAVTLDGNGIATTPDVTYVDAGSYSWKVVFTPAAGSNYTGRSTSCTTTADETAVIGYQAPSPIS